MRGESTDMNKTKEIQNIRQVFLKRERDLPCSLVIKTALPMQGPRVRSLVGELRSCMLLGQKKKKN